METHQSTDITGTGTCEGATFDNANAEPVWINDYPWRKLEVTEFPMQTIDKVKLNQQELTVTKTETQAKLINRTIITDDSNIKESSTYFTKFELDTEQTEKRYVYSQYLID